MINHSWHVDHVCCLLSLAGAATRIIFVVTKVLLRQKYACRNKTFVTTNTFVATKVFSRQKYFVATNIIFSLRQMFCHGKHTFVVTKIILVAAPANDSLQPDSVVLQYLYFKFFLYHSV